MKYIILISGIALLQVVATENCLAQKKELGYDEIFKGAPTGIIQPLPLFSRWLDDDHYLEYRPDGSNQQKLMRVDAKTGKAVMYSAGKEEVVEPTVSVQSDDVYYDSGNGRARQLTRSAGKEINPTLSADNKWVAFIRNNNLFAVETATGREIQFTRDGSETVYNGYASWVYFEEILGRASRYKAFWWSPDNRHLCFMRFDDTEVPVFPIYHADGQRGFLERQHYPKVGDKNPQVKVGMVSVEDTVVVWSDFNEKDDQYFGAPFWTPEGDLWVQWMPRSQDELKIFSVELKTGLKKEIYREQQKTWISLDTEDRIQFLKDGKGFVLKSDKSGWNQLYLYDMSGKPVNRITDGNFTVTEIIKIDEKSGLIYLTARRENSARTDFYKAGLNGKGLTRLSFGEFTHTVKPSPSVKYFVSTYSNQSSPPKMALVNAKGELVRELGDSKGSGFDQYNLPKTEIVRIRSADGLFDLPMSITYPIHFDSTKKYPVLVSIYGGPDAGRIFDVWPNAASPVAWWAREGLIQVIMDNRSSGHFGKMGMNYIYRQLGKYEIEDYMQCARWLKQKSFVDGSKICITGGSFGGYLTCMALTYGAEEFTHGIANSSVTGWELYDTHYTERFMDTPRENPEGYKNTSVLNYAEKYKGMLRIVHGTTDDNVHLQNSIQLINKLQDLKKRFEFMLYPGERHSIGANNPVKALHNRLEAYRFYYQYLLNKPMPEIFWE
ncbi:MAG: S9 family peptidase [Chitinophagaceae bacterium]